MVTTAPMEIIPRNNMGYSGQFGKSNITVSPFLEMMSVGYTIHYDTNMATLFLD